MMLEYENGMATWDLAQAESGVSAKFFDTLLTGLAEVQYTGSMGVVTANRDVVGDYITANYFMDTYLDEMEAYK